MNNPNIFAFMPYDPISNTSGVFSGGRGYTNHELDMPLNIYDVVRVVPYVQGQLVGWNNQIGGGPFNQQARGHGPVLGRGGRARARSWPGSPIPSVESELLNIHGLNHKINFYADFRAAYSNVRLNQIGVQDDLDDNTYEFVRRYFALTNYAAASCPSPTTPGT